MRDIPSGTVKTILGYAGQPFHHEASTSALVSVVHVATRSARQIAFG